MAVPTYVATGAGVQSTGTSYLPGYPAGLAAGDLLVLQVHDRSDSVNTPSGWTLQHQDLQDSFKQRIYTKVADGSETGTLTVTCGVSAFHAMHIHAFRGGTSMEGAALSNSDSTSMAAPSITTTGADRLVIAFVSTFVSQNIPSFTGETGGDYAEVAEFNGRLQVQTAAKASAGSITGGTATITSSDYVVRSFAIFSAGGAAAPPQRMLLDVGT